MCSICFPCIVFLFCLPSTCSPLSMFYLWCSYNLFILDLQSITIYLWFIYDLSIVDIYSISISFPQEGGSTTYTALYTALSTTTVLSCTLCCLLPPCTLTHLVYCLMLLNVHLLRCPTSSPQREWQTATAWPSFLNIHKESGHSHHRLIQTMVKNKCGSEITTRKTGNLPTSLFSSPFPYILHRVCPQCTFLHPCQKRRMLTLSFLSVVAIPHSPKISKRRRKNSSSRRRRPPLDPCPQPRPPPPPSHGPPRAWWVAARSVTVSCTSEEKDEKMEVAKK